MELKDYTSQALGVHFGIYQTDAEWRFMDWEFAKAHGFDMSAYDKVYDLEMPDGSTLEDVYVKLNADHPADYTGRSLSMGDVVEHAGKLYYVDDIGYAEVQVPSAPAAAVSVSARFTASTTHHLKVVGL